MSGAKTAKNGDTSPTTAKSRDAQGTIRAEGAAAPTAAAAEVTPLAAGMAIRGRV